MWKLQQLVEEKEKADKKAAEGGKEGGEKEKEGGDLQIKRSNSKELADNRKEKSKNNVFRIGGGAKRGRRGRNQVQSCELRVQSDLAEMDPEATPGVTVTWPDEKNLLKFNVDCVPADGLYEGANFTFSVEVTKDYPYHAPIVVCNTLVYHPNIDLNGRVCLNILRHDWKPVLTLGHVLFGIMTLFLEPNPDDPLNHEAADLMVKDRSTFENNVKKSLRGAYLAGHQFPKLL
eukprot:TRINITY_DN83_c0_g1_i1.p1 TRINITY_DN83_c0_g1~~TRINITY_DN83_c0_g1_i1.p1  ORF type:complete len:232 (-),score=75.22 TRINITY_DN83_c0_g1_i1:256-951(-)